MIGTKDIIYYKKRVISSFGSNKLVEYNNKPCRNCGSTFLHLASLIQDSVDRANLDQGYPSKKHLIITENYIQLDYIKRNCKDIILKENLYNVSYKNDKIIFNNYNEIEFLTIGSIERYQRGRLFDIVIFLDYIDKPNGNIDIEMLIPKSKKLIIEY